MIKILKWLLINVKKSHAYHEAQKGGHKKSSPDVSEELNMLKVYCKAII